MASLKQNVEHLLEARGLTKSELGTRIGMTASDLSRWLESPPTRQETVIKQIASALLVPDFFLFLDDPPALAESLVDFRLAKPRTRAYQRDTQKWIDLAIGIQRDVSRLGVFDAKRSIEHILPKSLNAKSAAKRFREAIGLTVTVQAELENPRLLFSYVRKSIEQYETFVLQLSFPDQDGAGFAVTSRKEFDIIVINTMNQLHSRRLFTLGHELYHCALNQSGISDPFALKNNIERQCNTFAVEFLAPSELVTFAASRTIKSKTLNLSELRAFAKLTKLSLYASVLRLVETNYYSDSAVAAWQAHIRDNGNPDFAKSRGGKPQDEWKNKLARFGFRFAEVYEAAKDRDQIDDYELYRLSGIKPKYQDSYLKNASSASLQDAGEEADGD